MKIFFFLFLLLSTTLSWAQARTATRSPSVKFRISPFAAEKRLETSTDPVLVSREPRHFSAGLRWSRHLFSLEYSQFEEKTGNETYRLEREFRDLLGWYRFTWLQKKMFRGTIGAGLGFSQEEVTTYFYELKNHSGSGSNWATGFALGVEWEPISFLVLSLDGRLMAGPNLDPNPHPGVLARLSVQF